MANGTLAASQIEMLSQSGTGIMTIVPPATNTNQTLTLPDSTGTVSTMGVGTAVSASGTSVDFTGIPSWAKRITVVISELSTNGTGNIRFQLGDSGGVETSGYAGIGAWAGASSAALASTSGFDSYGDSGATSSRSGSFVFSLLSPASNTWALQGMHTGGPSIGNFLFLTSGGKTLSATLDRVRITTVNGTDTFDAGTINIIYEG